MLVAEVTSGKGLLGLGQLGQLVGYAAPFCCGLTGEPALPQPRHFSRATGVPDLSLAEPMLLS